MPSRGNVGVLLDRRTETTSHSQQDHWKRGCKCAVSNRNNRYCMRSFTTLRPLVLSVCIPARTILYMIRRHPAHNGSICDRQPFYADTATSKLHPCINGTRIASPERATHHRNAHRPYSPDILRPHHRHTISAPTSPYNSSHAPSTSPYQTLSHQTNDYTLLSPLSRLAHQVRGSYSRTGPRRTSGSGRRRGARGRRLPR